MSSLQPFQRIQSSEKSGYIVIFVFALLSVFALSFIALRVLWLVVSPLFKRTSSQVVSKERIFFRTQLGRYAVCLLASNFFTSAAGVVVGNWLAEDGIQEGFTCTIQAVLMQIGNFASAYFTVAVALHTISSLVFRLQQTAWVGTTVMAVGWLSSVAIGVAPFKISAPGSGSAYGFDGFSCGIKKTFPGPQFLLHLLPIFVAAVASVIIYSLIFLVLRGTLVMKGGLKINLDPKQRYNFDEYHRFISAIARSMLWYPFAYNVLLLPYSITKLLEISGYPVAFGGNVFAYTCSFMLGLVNVCLLYNTFRVLEPAFGGSSNASYTRKTDMESNGDVLKTIAPLPAAMVVTSQIPEKYAPSIRAAGDSLLPSWQVSTNNSTSSWNSTSTLQNSVSSLDADSPIEYNTPDGYGRHSNPPVLSLSRADTIARPIVPISELNNALIAAPEPILQMSSVAMPNTRLQHNYRSSSAYSLQSSTGLPPPPRHKRSLVSRRRSNEIGTSSPFSKDQWIEAESRQGIATNALSQEASMTSVNHSQRGSFGVPYLSVPSRGQQGSISHLHLAFGAIASNAMPAPPPSVAMPPSTDHGIDDSETFSITPIASPQTRGLPRNVDNTYSVSVPVSARRTSDTPREEIYSSVGTKPVGLSPFALAAQVTGTAASDDSSSVQRNLLFDYGGNMVSPVPDVLRPDIAASVPSSRNVIIASAHPRQTSLNIIASMVSGDPDARVQEDPSPSSKKATISDGPLTPR